MSSAAYRNLISFIPETRNSDVKQKERKTRKIETQKFGQEVKSFYENLLNDDTCKNAREKLNTEELNTHEDTKQTHCSNDTRKSTRKRKCFVSGTKSKAGNISSLPCDTVTPSTSTFFDSHLPNPNERQHFKLLQCSQLGDAEAVKEFLDKGLDVNFSDFYQWTPLMCAAKEGHSHVIDLLLKRGADKYQKNSSGDTALSIAVDSGHSDVVSVISKHNTGDDTTVSPSDCDKSEPQVFHCGVCKRDFSTSEAISHQTSTVHLFNSGHRARGPIYSIPDSNRGFQMLLRSGWDGERGLGPEGKGMKYPIKTRLKQDRVGLGGDDEKTKKAKVTHFNRGDVEAVSFQKKNPLRQISVRKAAKKAARWKEKREKRWEQNLRFEMI